MEAKRAVLTSPDKGTRPMYYFDLPAPVAGTNICAAIEKAVALCRSSGCSTLIPQLPLDTELNDDTLPLVQEMYATLLATAKREGLCVGFHLDPALECAVIRAMDNIGDNSLRARILICREYVCAAREQVDRPIAPGILLSAVAYNEEYAEVVDLRPFIKDDRIVWQPPHGNYVVRQYLSVEDEAREGANYLSYEASRRYIEAVLSLFEETFAPYLGTTLTTLAYSGIGFLGANRRTFADDFNERFVERFGFDPAPYYPALFDYIGAKTAQMKAYFMTVRASLLQNGILRALRDVAHEHGLALFGSLSEPKLTGCSFSLGDTLQNGIYCPTALLDKAYMYGTNSIKIAAGAAYNFDIDRVNGELFRNYRFKDSDQLYRDAMNAFARGVNNTAVHLPEVLATDRKFGDFATRVQTILQDGRHVADIAMLYPIYHLHGKTSLYFSRADRYEYPATNSTADYMTLINSISIYAGHDLTVLHPDTLNTRCEARDGVLYLNNTRNHEQFRVVALPACDIVSVENMRVLERFFDSGGKLIATGVLPTKAFEHDETGDNDREVRRIAEHIFGHDACDPRIMRDYCYNKNEAGGEAYFLYFNASAVDGTKMIRSSTVNEALNAFSIPFDVYLPAMPRLECTGGLNSIYPEFHTVGLHRTIPGGGMLNHIHKAHDGYDIYYFSNSTQSDYNHHVLLRGCLSVEEWDPHNGIARSRKCRQISYLGARYTTLRLTLASGASTFFVTTPTDKAEDAIEVASIDRLRSDHAALMSEF